MSARELRARIGRRELSPVELMEATLRRADAVQDALNCFITICHDEALDAARQAEAQMVNGEPLGLLHGLPVSVKDIVDTKGMRTTYGSLLHADNVPAADAEAVARLRRAGAIVVGKTTTSEFGSKCLTDAPLFGKTANAWNRARTSGGSSGGAAASVAAGVTALAIATDGGGSTRIPAACNGVVGFKQSMGIVPHSQVADAFSNYTYVTPMTRDVADTALMMQALAGPHSSDPWSLGMPAPPFEHASHGLDEALRGKTVAYCPAPPGRPLAADVRDAFEHALATFETLGAILEPFKGDGFDVEDIWRVVNHTSWNGRFRAIAEQHGTRMSPSLLQQLALARNVDGVEFQQAMYRRTELFRHVQGYFERSDFLFTPTLMRTALDIDQDLFGSLDIDGNVYDEVRPNWFPWTMPYNLTGHPAISLPCGAASDGLPIGMQLVGRFKDDLSLLRAAASFEAAHRPLRPLAPTAQ